MKEQIKILSFQKEYPNLIINSNSEFYGACRHKPRFHRYAKTTPLSVLMTNNSSERVILGPISPPNLNNLTTTCSYVENELPVSEHTPLVNCGLFESDRTRELNYTDV